MWTSVYNILKFFGYLFMLPITIVVLVLLLLIFILIGLIVIILTPIWLLIWTYSKSRQTELID